MATDVFLYAYVKTLAEELDTCIGEIESALDQVPCQRHMVPQYIDPLPRPLLLVNYNPEHWEQAELGSPVMLDPLKAIQTRLEAMAVAMQESEV